MAKTCDASLRASTTNWRGTMWCMYVLCYAFSGRELLVRNYQITRDGKDVFFLYEDL